MPETEEEPTISLPPGVAAIEEAAVAARVAATAATALRFLVMVLSDNVGLCMGSRSLVCIYDWKVMSLRVLLLL